MPSDETIFVKLGEIPVINDGWTTAVNCYSKVKEFNNLTKLTLNVAESGIKKAVEITSPVVTNYKAQIESVNTYACARLEDIEAKYPVIKQPTNELKDACLDYVQPVVGKVKPVVTYAQGVVNSGKKKVNDIKTCGSNLVTGARDLGVGTVTRAVTMTLQTPPGRFVTKTVDGALSCADDLMDRYIPEQTEPVAKDDDNNEIEGARPEQMTLMEPSPERVAVHFRTVSTKLRRRMFQKAMRDFQGAKLRTMEAVGKLHNTVDLIDYAKNNLNSAKDKVEDLWNKINETSEESQDKPETSGTFEQRIVSLGRLLAARVKNGISTLEKASAEVGQFIRHPISKTEEYKHFIYMFSTDISNFSVKKAKESLTYIQNRLAQMADNVESAEWLTVDIDMSDIDLQEDDLKMSRLSEDSSSDHESRKNRFETSVEQPEAGETTLKYEESHPANESKYEDVNSGQESEEDDEKKAVSDHGEEHE
ncbi:perilipin-2 [Biomphalaria pfeifferi]|uniref:Perilipin-2 n=1 Tax=Biomphalaria pfeifferi TaxID=112525 RepID=A0AAD8BQQ6_BIOPF|nr:perilipin-2 [Biomphalaria pfeifferi]